MCNCYYHIECISPAIGSISEDIEEITDDIIFCPSCSIRDYMNKNVFSVNGMVLASDKKIDIEIDVDDNIGKMLLY